MQFYIEENSIKKITIEDIKIFRQETGYKLSDCKEALEKCNGGKEKAKNIFLINGQKR